MSHRRPFANRDAFDRALRQLAAGAPDGPSPDEVLHRINRRAAARRQRRFAAVITVLVIAPVLALWWASLTDPRPPRSTAADRTAPATVTADPHDGATAPPRTRPEHELVAFRLDDDRVVMAYLESMRVRPGDGDTPDLTDDVSRLETALVRQPDVEAMPELLNAVLREQGRRLALSSTLPF